jgi:hypothetical protein
MLSLASDADVRGTLIRGLRRRLPTIDLVRSVDSLPPNAPDQEVLAWAAGENRVLITNDRSTMIGVANARVAAGQPMPGLIVTTNRQAVGPTINDLVAIVDGLSAEDVRNRVLIFLPLPDGSGFSERR